MWDLGAVEVLSLTESSRDYAYTYYSDMEINNFTADGSRYYVVHFTADWIMSAAGRWDIYLHIDQSAVGKLGTIIGNGSGINEDTITGHYLWSPSSGEYDLAVHATRAVGTPLFYWYADSATPRQFWIEDKGPR